jgi:hypothetical protein
MIKVEITRMGYDFRAKYVASDGILPDLFGGQHWALYAKNPDNYNLRQAICSYDSLLSKLPNFSFSLPNDRSESVVVRKWYCPFMFVKEGMELKEQMKISTFYKLTLKQIWEKIFLKENENCWEGDVLVDVVIQTEVVKVTEKYAAVWDDNRWVDWVLWF